MMVREQILLEIKQKKTWGSYEKNRNSIRHQHSDERFLMTHTGRCYCGQINFEFDDPIHSQLICHCRECRQLSGGKPNASIVISEKNFRVSKGELKRFARSDLEAPRVRYFCDNCGTHVCVKSPPRPGMLVLKIGTIDDHSWFIPQASIYCIDKQPLHQVRDGVPDFERTPPPII